MGPIHRGGWSSTGTCYQFRGHCASGFSATHPHLAQFRVLITKDQVVRSEMEGADVRAIRLGTDDPLDLFRNEG